MYKAIKGIFENGQILLKEMPPTTHKSKVVILFMEPLEEPTIKKGVRQLGKLQRLGELQKESYGISHDFDAPIDDLKDYM
jgi:hypothetical protein